MVPTHRQPQALILAPTRELALQVARELTQIGKHRGIIVEALYGGAPIGKQITALRDGVHIVVGTPGRVLDHIGRRTLDLQDDHHVRARRVRRDALDGLPRGHRAHRLAPAGQEADAAVLGDDARRGRALLAPPHGDARADLAVARPDLGLATSTTPTTSSAASRAAATCSRSSSPRSRRARSSSATRATRPRWSRSSCRSRASTPSRCRVTCRRTIASA